MTEKYEKESVARARALALEDETGYACVIYSPHPETGNFFYVETETPMIRNWETLIYETP